MNTIEVIVVLLAAFCQIRALPVGEEVVLSRRGGDSYNAPPEVVIYEENGYGGYAPEVVLEKGYGGYAPEVVLEKGYGYAPQVVTDIKVLPVPNYIPSYNQNGFVSSKARGDTYLNAGTLGGDGGDIINSAQTGIAHTGGGENEILSSVEGFNNLGVSDGYIQHIQPLSKYETYDIPGGYGQVPANSELVGQFGYGSGPLPLSGPYKNNWGLAGGISTSRVRGLTKLGNGVLGGDGGDTLNSVQNGILHSGGGRNGIVSAVQGSNNQGVVREVGAQRYISPVIRTELVGGYVAPLVQEPISYDAQITATGGAYSY